MRITYTEKAVKNKKEAQEWVGYMNLLKYHEEYEGNIRGLANLIDRGHTLIPAILTENEVSKSGEYTKRRSNFHSLNCLALDIENKSGIQFTVEDAKKIMVDNNLEYSLIYNTFSNAPGNPRFRIIFDIDRPITDFWEAKAYMQYVANFFIAEDGTLLYDPACIDPLRLFYPGKTVEIREDIKLNLNSIDISNILIRDTPKRSKKVQKFIEDGAKIAKPVVLQREAKQDVQLQSIIDYINEKITEETEIDWEDRYDYICQLCKITDLFDVYRNNKFMCILPGHNEKDGSAYVYFDDDTIGGTHHEVYHCWGCEERLNIIQLIERIHNIDDIAFFKSIEYNTKLVFGSKYQKEGRKIIQDTQSYIRKRLKEDNPKVYNYLKNRNLFGILNELLQFGADHLSTQPLLEDSREVCFFLSTGELARLMYDMQGRNITQHRACEKVNTLAMLGVINKVELSYLRGDVKERAKHEMEVKKKKNYVNFYTLGRFTPDNLKRIEDLITKNKEIGVKAKFECKEQIARTQSQENADKVYVQKKKQYEMKDKFFALLSKKVNELIDKQGYFTEKEIIKAIDPKGNTYKVADKEKKVAMYLPQYITTPDGYSIKRTKCNKTVRAEFSIPEKISSNSFVYIKTNI